MDELGGSSYRVVPSVKGPSDVTSLLALAEQAELKYGWTGAAELYQRASSVIPQERTSQRGEIKERESYATYRSALQAETASQFRAQVEKAIRSLEEALRFYSESEGQRLVSRMHRCNSARAYLRSWLSPNPRDRKQTLAESWRIAKQALRSFEEAQESLEYGKTFDQLSLSARFEHDLEEDYVLRESTVKELVDYGKRACNLVPSTAIPLAARIFAKTALATAELADRYSEERLREKLTSDAQSYWRKAVQYSEKTAVLELLFLMSPDCLSILGWGYGTDETLEIFRKLSNFAEETRDRLLCGWALDFLAYHTLGKQETVEDPFHKVNLLGEASIFASRSRDCYKAIGFTSPRNALFWVEAPEAEKNWTLAQFEMDLEKRRILLKQAVEQATSMQKQAEASSYPLIVSYGHHLLSRASISLAKIENDSDSKKQLLESALSNRQVSMSMDQGLEPFDYWTQGVNYNYLAEARSELAKLADANQDKVKLLEEAVSDKEKSIALCSRDLEALSRGGAPWPHVVLGGYGYGLGTMLFRLRDYTENSLLLSKAGEAFDQAAKAYIESKLASRAAECYWRKGQSHDLLAEHLKAAESFELASDFFKQAARNIPQLADLYKDYSTYMRAWGAIEKAESHHMRHEFVLAKSEYLIASDLHRSTNKWNFLAPNYSAWARVEEGEELSRRELAEEAINSFEAASQLFGKAKTSIEEAAPGLKSSEEKEMAVRLLFAVQWRQKYLKARAEQERAKTQYRRGEYRASAETSGTAVEVLEQLVLEEGIESGTREMAFITSLSKGWQMMASAEAETSGLLYSKAALEFQRAKEYASDENAGMLALGLSHLCKALEAGIVFVDTRDTSLHGTITKHLQTATDYYVRAGHATLSDYARGTKLLFEAYRHVDEARQATDLESQVSSYMMAERVLAVSASSFEKAGYPSKKSQVLSMLESAREDKDLTLSLVEIIRAPPIQSVSSITVPSPSTEEPVGAETFSHASVHGRLQSAQRTLKIGETIEVTIELANAGAGSAQLLRIEHLIPAGLELVNFPQSCQVVKGNLEMGGRQLGPLKAEAFKLVLRPTAQGLFTLMPRVAYLDEIGRAFSGELQPFDVLVSPIVEFLAKCFVEDYADKRLSPDQAGWRTLMNIVEELRVPKGQVYGDSKGGHTLAKPIRSLVHSGTLEYRLFSGERGRGGSVVKLRVSYGKEPVKRLVEELTLKPLHD